MDNVTETIERVYRETGLVRSAAHAAHTTYREAYTILDDKGLILHPRPPKVIGIRCEGEPLLKATERTRKRDGYVCQLCGRTQKTRALHVHHIDFSRKNNVQRNLVTLCESCHRLAHGVAKKSIQFALKDIVSWSI